MLESGFKISDLKNIPTLKTIDNKSRIAYDNTFLLSYSHTVYGINYNRQNYKIPLTAIRDDIKGYIGIETLVAPWSEQLKIWHGSWENRTDKNKSYVHIWKEEEWEDEHYFPEKFKDLNNSFYIIKDIPLPFETSEYENIMGEDPYIEVSDGNAYAVGSINLPKKKVDPYPESNKIVTKDYVDERLSSKRLIEVGIDFTIRDYDCTYVIRNKHLMGDEPITINIHYPREVKERILHNKLDFTILIEGKLENEQWIPALKHNLSWKIIKDWELDDNKVIEPKWMNKLNNLHPDLTERLLYEKCRFVMIRFESVTNNIILNESKESTEAGDLVTNIIPSAEFSVYALCENLVYRRTGINVIHDDILENGTTLRLNSDSIDISVSENDNEDDIININLESLTEVRGDDFINSTKDSNTWNLKFNEELLPVVTTDILEKYINVTVNKDKHPIEYQIGFNESLLKEQYNSLEIYDINKNPINLNEVKDINYFINANNKEGNLNELIIWFYPPSEDVMGKNVSKNINAFINVENYDITSFKLIIDGYPDPMDLESWGTNPNYKQSINWTMSELPPKLKAGYLYNVSFSYLSPIVKASLSPEETGEDLNEDPTLPSVGFDKGQIFARINWFTKLKS